MKYIAILLGLLLSTTAFAGNKMEYVDHGWMTPYFWVCGLGIRFAYMQRQVCKPGPMAIYGNIYNTFV